MPTTLPPHNNDDEERELLAQQGWELLPCKPTEPGAKRPLTANGFKDASGDPEQLRRWWQQSPDAMTGAVPPPQTIGFDSDPRNGGSIGALAKGVGTTLPDTLACWSGRGDGGRHAYYRVPSTAGLCSTNLPAGIDLKIAGRGYLIVPPSKHPATGLRYRWGSLHSPDVVELPPIAWLPAKVLEALRTPRRSAPSPESIEALTGRRGRSAGLLRTVSEALPGKRNAVLFWAGCRAGENGDLDSIWDALINAAVSTGLSERAAIATLRSAQRTAGVAS